MFLSVGSEEYLLTAGLLASFVGFVISLFYSRKDTVKALRSAGFKPKHLVAALAIVLLFIVVEGIIVKPTQLLFFDDAIYQGMALDLLHLGQAVMCNFGTPSSCFVGQVFHEPVGTALNIAIGYLISGVHLQTVYGTGLAISALAVFMTIICGALLFRNANAALFSGIFMALSPILLVWAYPTTSDMPMLLYVLVALFALLVFIRVKSRAALAMVLFSAALMTYMKIDAIVMLPVIFIGFLLLANRNPIAWLKSRYRGKFDGMIYLLFIIFVALVAISVAYAYSQSRIDNFGSQGTTVPNTCNSAQSLTANGPFSGGIFLSNICANVGFFFGNYNRQYIMQPLLFTIFAAVGAVIMLSEKKRVFAFISLWFLLFFIVYTAFYAGAVTFGIDWRFMLAAIAPVCLFAGYGAERLSGIFADDMAYMKKKLKRKSLLITDRRVTGTMMRSIVLVLIVFSFVGFVPLLSIQPSQIQQAGDARFYESFVFNNTGAIPSSCLVFSYDPTLFMINNRSSAQLYYLYNSSFMKNATKHYSCLIEDRGFWCYTPNNLCTGLNATYSITPLLTSEYGTPSKTFGFYYLKQK